MRHMKGIVGRVALLATVFAAICVATAPTPSFAGIKYWDNPAYRAFDVDCYVKAGDNDLIWNYDGIRNVGATADHDQNALTWANLGSFGSANDIVLQRNNSGWTALTSAELSSETYGKWTDNGFTFKGNSRFRRDSPGKITVGTSYTIQFLVDATASGQKNTLGFLFGVQFDQFSMAVAKNEDRFYWRNLMAYKAASNSHSLDSFLAGGTFDYGTAIVDGTDKTTAFFSGTKAPTSGDGFRQYDAVYNRDEAGYVIGSTGSATGYEFVGTIKFFRVYNHALSDEEVAWNRVVDEARFFNRVAPLPVTNAVVVSSVAASVEPSGTYAVDGRHVFTAPRVATVDNAKYICTGYTLETWNSETGDWSAPVFHARELSCKVEDSDCVRITWKWMDGEGIKTYDVSDYVWDGLEVFYDGICNQGTNVAHSTTATNWVNLGSKGSANDVFVQRLNTAGAGWTTATDLTPDARDPGYWTDNGFLLRGESRFRCNSPGGFSVGTDYSLQMLIDAKAADKVNNNYAYLLGANSSTFALRISAESGNLLWKYKNGSDDYPCLKGGTYDYMTAIMSSDNKQLFFNGTTLPTSGDGYRTDTSQGFSENGFCLGGYGSSGTANFFVGTFKNFRQYSRALTAEEVAQNRKVDDWRYFGKFAETDVIVQSTYAALQGNEPDGEYDIDGSHTFTAPENVTIKVNGKEITYACDGYIVETRDGSTWVNATSSDVNSYAYTAGTSPELVRLTWKWKPVRGLRTAADYSFDDYSQAGLLWNYDGIRNQGGTDADHDSTATTWKNLGSGGAAYDLSWNGETTTGEWAPDGYIFRGGPRFRSGGKVGPIKNFTLQTLIDADIASQTATSTKFSYIMNAYDGYFNISLVSPSYDGSAASSFCWKAQGDASGNNSKFMYFHAKDNHYDYATAMMDYDNKKAMMFPDTVIPTEYHKDGTYGAQRLYNEFDSVIARNTTGYGLGNRNSNGTEGMVGKIKNFRYYDRVLTEEEIVRNRNVDSVRYFGALGVTNVLVTTKYGDGTGETLAEAPGAYTVEGSWTFSATQVKDQDGILKNVAGYYTEELDVYGKWTNKVWHEGAAQYTYNAETENGKTIRLTWSAPPPGMSVIIR